MKKLFAALALCCATLAVAQTNGPMQANNSSSVTLDRQGMPNGLQGHSATGSSSSAYNAWTPTIIPPPNHTVNDMEAVCEVRGMLHPACARAFADSRNARAIADLERNTAERRIKLAQLNMQNCQQGQGQNCAPVQSQIKGPKDPLTNPDAVPHRIDRSAMDIQIQGWTRDLRYPVYPIAVMQGANGVYYTTNENVKDYKEFDFDELRCEIGDAEKSVLTSPGYACADGVCMSKEGAILGTDPRKKSKKGKCQ